MLSPLFPRRLTTLTALLTALLMGASSPAFALGWLPWKQPRQQEQTRTLKATSERHQQLLEALTLLYGKEQAPELLRAIQTKISKARLNRPLDLKRLDESRSVDWYKDEVVYMLYPDRFGLEPEDKPTGGDFYDVAKTLDYLEALNVTTIYVLPFMASPMGDAGFDVSNFYKVREDLGGNPAFKQFLSEAKKRGFKLKSDLILNHISEEHPWFQAALEGDKEKLDYFVYTTEKPDYKKYQDPQRGVVVDYQEPEGVVSSRRLMFPEQTASHYRPVEIGGDTYYFYHTFYPFQLDVNWKNPELMLEMLDALAYWANLGVDIFRLDAVPYFVQEPGTDGENSPGTHAVVKILSAFVQEVAPASVLQVEACQWPADIRPYFGEEPKQQMQALAHSHPQGEEEPITETCAAFRTDEVQIAYNFPYMPAMWASMITGDAAPFWEAVDSTPDIPASATWALFLRVHDELTLEMVDLETRKTVYDALVAKGQPFRAGLGVSGRMANFFNEDARRITQAFALLLSLPGMPIIYYGDELGMTNDEAFAEAYAELRAASSKNKSDLTSAYDSRDINRNPVRLETLEAVLKGEAPARQDVLFKQVAHLVATRLASRALRRGELEPLKLGNKSLLAYQRLGAGNPLTVLHNLSGEVQLVTLDAATLFTSAAATQTLTDLISSVALTLEVKNGQVQFELAPYQSVWLQKRGFANLNSSGAKAI